ncbi:MAG: metallophosphoesterase, partial [Ignavibacteria bacterium]|nr:metallophosphoesterase [Ignavibacteria bacterium]
MCIRDRYMDERDMSEYAGVINQLGSDIICIPGDFVNFEVKDVHPLTRAFRDLNARYGVYGSLGNHDFFQNADYVTKAINNESPIQILRNEHRKITLGGKDIYIMGVDDTIRSGVKMEDVLKYYNSMDEYLMKNESTFADSPKILLCHKPYGFDILSQKNIDLVLSGHTHGGQVVPVKLGNFNLSFAATVSKYIEGHYKLGKSNMYVSRGIGSVGLPVRINCPPEITVLRLV